MTYESAIDMAIARLFQSVLNGGGDLICLRLPCSCKGEVRRAGRQYQYYGQHTKANDRDLLAVVEFKSRNVLRHDH